MKIKPSIKRPWIVAWLAVSLMLVVACRPHQVETGPIRPPVILVVIDTLRADHVGCYGYERDTTPNLDALAADAVRFANAHAAASWTVPSMTSLLTGVYPWDHGITKAEVINRGKVGGQPLLSERFLTLAESLQAAGYATFGVSANYHLNAKFGMGQGFDQYQVFGWVARGPVDRQVDAWLGEMRNLRKEKKPYFLFVHYFDPHHPYLPQPEHLARWRKNVDLQAQRQYFEDRFLQEIDTEEIYNDPEHMSLLIDLYDAEIVAADESVGRLLQNLPDVDESLVIVTADHGEAFGEHRNMIHGLDLYAETERVPLLIKLPNGERAGQVMPDHVSLIDLYPTIAGFAGAEKPKYLAGIDMLGASLSNQAAERLLFASIERSSAHRWRSIITGDRKWMLHEGADEQFLFDLAADPAEKNNIFDKQGENFCDFMALWVSNAHPSPLFPPGESREMDPEERRQLKNLGYIGN